jgi:putative acetyltransferase
MSIVIRPYDPADTAALAAVFRQAVIGTGATAYNAEQVAVWSEFVNNLDRFQHRLSAGLTLVAWVEGRVAAFGQLHPPDHIEFLYTDSAFARTGCATQIYQALEAQAQAQNVTCLHTEASHISKYFFLKMGFYVVEPEIVERDGVLFERFKMEKQLKLDG